MECKVKGPRGHCENCGEDVVLVERKRIEEFRVVGTDWVCPFCGKAVKGEDPSGIAGSQGQEAKGKKRLAALFGGVDAREEGERINSLGSLFGDGKAKQDKGMGKGSLSILEDVSEVHCCRECFHCTFNLYHCHCCYYNKDVEPTGDCEHYKAREKGV